MDDEHFDRFSDLPDDDDRDPSPHPWDAAAMFQGDARLRDHELHWGDQDIEEET
ncbi:MAG: hypothetical protein LKM39_11455 [Chiayiivirga sp.]|jgi:hypothetical protein|nr:hypothetical protein [Chiayiivirga sp.]